MLRAIGGVCVVVGVMLLVAQAKAAETRFAQVRWLRCFDGDTCRFEVLDVPRLFGRSLLVYLPVQVKARPTPKGKQTHQLVMRLLYNAKRISLRQVRWRKANTLEAVVCVDGVALSSHLLASGLATLRNPNLLPKNTTTLWAEGEGSQPWFITKAWLLLGGLFAGGLWWKTRRHGVTLVKAWLLGWGKRFAAMFKMPSQLKQPALPLTPAPATHSA